MKPFVHIYHVEEDMFKKSSETKKPYSILSTAWQFEMSLGISSTQIHLANKMSFEIITN